MKENYTKLDIEEMRYELWFYLYDNTWCVDDLSDVEVVEYYKATFAPEFEEEVLNYE